MAWLLTMSLEGLSLQLGTSWDALARRLEFSPAEIQGFNHANNGKNSQTNLTACGKRKVVCQEQITRSCTRPCVINMLIAKI